jgi:transposase
MPEAYSLDLRERVARFVEGGRSCRAAAALFSVSVAFVVRLMKPFRATGRLAPSAERRTPPRQADPHRRFCSAASPKKPT